MTAPRSPIHIELTVEERIELTRRARLLVAPHRVVTRAKIILGLVNGSTVSALARDVDVQRKIVRKWAYRFVRRRLAGLEDEMRSGAPSRFSPGRGDAPGQARV